MIRFTRSGGRRPPQDREILEIADDGAYTLWRSIGSAAYPSTPVGRFSGTLSESQLDQLKSLCLAAAQSGDLTRPMPPGSAVANIQIGDVTAKMGIHDEPEGPWGELLPQLVELLRELTSSPQAALGISVAGDGMSATLNHLGSEPLSVSLANLTVRAVLWEGYLKVGDWFAPVDEALPEEPIAAEADWRFELPFDHGFDIGEENRVVAYVTLMIADGELMVPVKLDSG